METSQELTLAQVEDVLLHGGDLAVVEADQVQDDMVQRVISAASLEEAFQGFKATPAAELEGIAVTINGIAFMRSAFDEGPKVYALLDAVITESDLPVTISMGGRTLMASFTWALRHDAMPVTGAFVRERSNTNTERQFWTFKLQAKKV